MKGKPGIIDNFSVFTKTEGAVLLFLCLLFLSGLMYRYYILRKESAAQQYDYSRLDSLFFAADSQDKNLVSAYQYGSTGKYGGKQLKVDAGSSADSKGLSGVRGRQFENRVKKLQPGEGSVNLNTAGLNELRRLPGIGEKTAERIIELRKQKGSFNTVEELLEVKGIGKAKFEKLKMLIRIE